MSVGTSTREGVAYNGPQLTSQPVPSIMGTNGSCSEQAHSLLSDNHNTSVLSSEEAKRKFSDYSYDRPAKVKGLPKRSCIVVGDKQFPLDKRLLAHPHMDYYFLKERTHIGLGQNLVNFVIQCPRYVCDVIIIATCLLYSTTV